MSIATRCLRPAVVGLLACVLSAASAEAQTGRYTVTRITDTVKLAGVAGSRCLAVNSSGTVLFATAEGQIWMGTGASLTEIAAAGPSGQPIGVLCPGLNDLGEVVYGFEYASPAYSALLKRSGTIVTGLARSDATPFPDLTATATILSLTEAGHTFVTGLDGRLYTMPSGALAFPHAAGLPPLRSVVAGTMNDAGIIAFAAQRETAPGILINGLHRGSATPLIEDGTAGVTSIRLAPPAINNSGTMVFLGILADGRTHVLTTSDGVTVVDRSGPLNVDPAGALAMSDAGTVVFSADLGSGQRGIFTGPDAVADKVVAPGDLLDGSIVVSATGRYDAINARGQIAFRADLADGRSGLYLASPIIPLTAHGGALTVVEDTAGAGTLRATDPAAGPVTYALVTGATRGTVTLTDAATGAYSYVPHRDATGSDSFTFQASSGAAVSAPAAVTVTITPVNDAPVAWPLTATQTHVRFDGASDELRRTTALPAITGFTAMGWFRLAADRNTYQTFLALGHATSSQAYLLLTNADGTTLGFWNGSGMQVGPALTVGTWYHLAVSVAGAGPGQVKVYLNSALAFTAAGNPAVPAARFSIGNNSHLQWLNGYAADVRLYQAVLTAAEIAQERQQPAPVRLADLHGWYPLQTAATATTDASGQGRPLTLAGTLTTEGSAAAITTLEDTPLTGTLPATDVDGDPLTYTIVTPPTAGTVTLADPRSGAFTYTPQPDRAGADTFTFQVDDGRAASAPVSVALTITPVNDPPVLAGQALTVGAGAAVSGRLPAPDVDSPTVTYGLATPATQGTVTLDATTGAFTYTAAPTARGLDTFTVQATDGQQASAPALVTVTVAGTPTPVNHAPGPRAPAGAVRFDAPGDELVRTTALPPSTGFTAMGWFRLAADRNTYQTFLALGHPTSSEAYVLMTNADGTTLALWSGGTVIGPALTVGTWYHLAMTVAGPGPGQFKAYLNGALAITSNGNPAIPAARLSIGNDSHYEWLDGDAAAVKLYDVVLTAAEIAQELRQPAPVRTAGLNSWYPLAAAADAVRDASGQDRTLTLTGALATAGPPPLVTAEGTPLHGILPATDPDGDPLTYTLLTPPSRGTVTLTDPATGAFVYTPHPQAAGPDTLTFQVHDTALASPPLTLPLFVAATAPLQ